MGKVVYESTTEELVKRPDIQISYLGVSKG